MTSPGLKLLSLEGECVAMEKGQLTAFRRQKPQAVQGLVWTNEEQAVVVGNCDAKAVKADKRPRKFLLNVESWAKKTTAENSIPSV